MEIILEWENANSNTTNGGSHASLPPSVAHGSERAVEMQFRGDNPSTSIVASLPMGRGFVGLTRVLSWVGSGSLGRAPS